jgi:hypothetical protein
MADYPDEIKTIHLPGPTRCCDLCSIEDKEQDAEYDMPTIFGSWGYVCELHLRTHVPRGGEKIGTHIVWTG